MDSNFSFFTFSVFIGVSFDDFYNAVKRNRFYNELLEKNKAHLESNSTLNLQEYINPVNGFALEKFSWWTSMLYPNMVFLSSNLCDGLQTGCFSLQRDLKCICINFSVSPDGELFQKNHFEYISSNGEERIVMAIKEERWTFYQEGTPLPFEDISFYSNRRVSNKMNFNILKIYLKRLGIEFKEIDSHVSKCMTFKRYE